MKHKTPNRNHKKDDQVSRQTPKSEEPKPRLFRNDKKEQQGEKLQLKDYLYTFPTCNQGSTEEIYLDEITVYYSFN